VAKKATRKAAGKAVPKKTAAKARKKAGRKTAARKAPARKTTAARRTSSATARKKTAARSAATRKRRQAPVPPAPSRLSVAAAAIAGTVAGAVGAVAGKLRRAKTEPDAIELLEQEHRRFEALLKQGEDSTERARKGRRELLDTLAAALNTHELMEERVLYPALQSHPQARDIVLEGFEEHHVADVILKELHEVAKDDEQWGAKFKVLKESIEHHIQEEEGPMFRAARGVMSQEDLAALGKQMANMKREAEAGRLPK